MLFWMQDQSCRKKKEQKSVGSFWVFALLWPRAHTCLPQPSFPPSLMPRNQTHSYLLPCNHLLLENTPRQRKTLWWEKPPLNNFKFVGICIHTCLPELLLSHVFSPQWKTYLMWCFFFYLNKALCFLWKVLFQHSSYFIFIFLSVVLLEKSCCHHLFITHSVEKDLSHYPGEAWDESVWDFSSCLIDGRHLFFFHVSVHFKNHLLRSLQFSLQSLSLQYLLSPPLLLRKSLLCIYYCLLTITRRDWVTDDDKW